MLLHNFSGHGIILNIKNFFNKFISFTKKRIKKIAVSFLLKRNFAIIIIDKKRVFSTIIKIENKNQKINAMANDKKINKNITIIFFNKLNNLLDIKLLKL